MAKGMGCLRSTLISLYTCPFVIGYQLQMYPRSHNVTIWLPSGVQAIARMDSLLGEHCGWLGPRNSSETAPPLDWLS